MARLEQLIDHLDGVLEPEGFADYQPNGIQVPGPTEIETVVTGVSANAALFERAAEEGADLVLVHHGLFWDGTPRALDRPMRRKLKLLFDHDMALASYHLPLDAHPQLGNNALLADALGAGEHVPFAPHGGRPLGVAARFPGEGVSASELVARVREACAGREPLALLEGPDPVRTIGIVTGAAADDVMVAVAAGLDAFLTGEPAERVAAMARENEIHFLAAGHHATERFGVRALGELLAERFGVRHVYVDVDNPI